MSVISQAQLDTVIHCCLLLRLMDGREHDPQNLIALIVHVCFILLWALQVSMKKEDKESVRRYIVEQIRDKILDIHTVATG